MNISLRREEALALLIRVESQKKPHEWEKAAAIKLAAKLGLVSMFKKK